MVYKSMLRLLNNPEKGVTLVEIIVTVMLVGILAAFTLPNMFKQVQDRKTREAMNTVNSILQDVQKQALRRGTGSCTLELGKSSGSTGSYYDRVRVSPLGCLVAVPSNTETVSSTTYHSVILPSNISVATNITATTPKLIYSYKGHITDYTSLVPSGQTPTLVLFQVDSDGRTALVSNQQSKKCLIASSLLGLTVLGNYDVSDAAQLSTASITSAKCTPSSDGTK
jgi:prepilin-type N-terminal cleavage/methylation domain-containing protein